MVLNGKKHSLKARRFTYLSILATLSAIIVLACACNCPPPSAAVTDVDVNVTGDTIYIIRDNELQKSVDGGATFTTVQVSSDFTAPPKNLDVSPGDPYTLVVSDSSSDEVVWRSNNGGWTWSSLGSPCQGGDTLTDLALSPTGDYVFATLADNMGGSGVTKGDVMMLDNTNTWTGIAGVSGTHDYMAVEVSPSFLIDTCICVVGAYAETNPLAVLSGYDFQVISIATDAVIKTVGFIPAETVSDYSTTPSDYSMIYADIALPTDYNAALLATDVAYVCVCRKTVRDTDDVYRIFADTADQLNVAGGAGISIRSICFGGPYATGTLLAGEHENTVVWRTSDPAALVPTWASATTPPDGESDAVLCLHPSFETNGTCYAGTSGDYGDFFISTNMGDDFS